jgi:predicted nucleic acid-binding protein
MLEKSYGRGPDAVYQQLCYCREHNTHSKKTRPRKVRDFQTKILALLQIEWVDEAQHISAIETVLQANRRKLSLIDCSAFQTINSLGINTVFTFDPHFAERGFNVIP